MGDQYLQGQRISTLDFKGFDGLLKSKLQLLTRWEAEQLLT